MGHIRSSSYATVCTDFYLIINRLDLFFRIAVRIDVYNRGFLTGVPISATLHVIVISIEDQHIVIWKHRNRVPGRLYRT